MFTSLYRHNGIFKLCVCDVKIVKEGRMAQAFVQHISAPPIGKCLDCVCFFLLFEMVTDDGFHRISQHLPSREYCCRIGGCFCRYSKLHVCSAVFWQCLCICLFVPLCCD